MPEPLGRESGPTVGRRVRDDVADGAKVMVFSLASSVVLASVLALVLGSL